jgi:REP element-mobilizing transposase RayT
LEQATQAIAIRSFIWEAPMRIKRQQSPVDLYHVIARGTGRQIIFEDDADRRVFLDICASALGRYSAELYAWCLMSNHVHLVVHATMDNLASFMKSLCGQYARYFNKKSERSGHLFQERYRSEAIADEQYLLTVVRYVHNNPEKAGICEARDYPWSSYHEYAGTPELSSTELVLDLIGGASELASFHREYASSDCIDIAEQNRVATLSDDRAANYAQEILGRDTFLGIKGLDRAERNSALVQLRNAGFSIRQVERLTGIGRGVIFRIWAGDTAS